jgi:hypothetical protein
MLALRRGTVLQCILPGCVLARGNSWRSFEKLTAGQPGLPRGVAEGRGVAQSSRNRSTQGVVRQAPRCAEAAAADAQRGHAPHDRELGAGHISYSGGENACAPCKL